MTAAVGAPFLAAACIDWQSLSPPGGAGLDGGDAGAEEAAARDAGSDARWCATQDAALALCDDFDLGALGSGALGSAWTENAVTADAVLELAPSVRSLPSAMSNRTRSLDGGQGWSYLRKDLGTAPTQITVGFDLSIASLGGTYAEVAGVDIQRGDGSFYALTIRVYPSGALSLCEVGTYEGGASKQNQELFFAKHAPAPDWSRLTLAMSLGAASARVFLDADPAPVVDMALTPSLTDGTRNAKVGMTYFLVDGWAVLVDNVTLGTSF